MLLEFSYNEVYKLVGIRPQFKSQVRHQNENINKYLFVHCLNVKVKIIMKKYLKSLWFGGDIKQ